MRHQSVSMRDQKPVALSKLRRSSRRWWTTSSVHQALTPKGCTLSTKRSIQITRRILPLWNMRVMSPSQTRARQLSTRLRSQVRCIRISQFWQRRPSTRSPWIKWHSCKTSPWCSYLEARREAFKLKVPWKDLASLLKDRKRGIRPCKEGMWHCRRSRSQIGHQIRIRSREPCSAWLLAGRRIRVWARIWEAVRDRWRSWPHDWVRGRRLASERGCGLKIAMVNFINLLRLG